MFEKLWVKSLGVGLNCLFVRLASSRAIKRPRIVTIRAASLREGCIVITGVLGRTIFEVISSPAMMLPHARRLMGLTTAVLFSLMGENELKRGWPMETKKTTRKL